jgi:serine/threonine-protein kinase HipA
VEGGVYLCVGYVGWGALQVAQRGRSKIMSGRQRSVQVYVDTAAAEPVLMGTLHAQSGDSKDTFSFAYDPEWLEREQTVAFHPDLPFNNFGLFLDSSPDRWGRLLMQRGENLRARQEGRKPRRLTAWDHLLGVHDETRLGALRFRSPAGGEFLGGHPLAAPPITSVRELQTASWGFEQHIDEEDNPEYARCLNQLLAPGASLGGARPKASVRDEEGALCIAKFPSRADTRDIAAWEMLAHRLGEKCGIQLPKARLLDNGERDQSTFLVNRFDRTVKGGRLAFVSAMTLTQRSEGYTGASYLELVELLQRRGANTRADTHQLYRRIVFSILIHNTDDHLRNHGFFVEDRGVRLSPAYDINPSVERDDHVLAINETETASNLEIARAAHNMYALSLDEADRLIAEVLSAVKTWRNEARALGIRKSEQEQMASAFPA